MKLGILETGYPPRELQPAFGDYPGMFRALLGEDAYDYTTFKAAAGVLPAAPEACDAYLVTGSPAGVYDDRTWIAPLLDFLRAAKGRAALVGICFGHQAMAQAFGGKVIKSPRGWGTGLHDYAVVRRADWMDAAASFRVSASHQDQVVVPPPDAAVLAGSDFTPFGMLQYADQPAISLQLHPEFETGFARALIDNRKGSPYERAAADAALASYDAPDDRLRVAGWVRAFLAQSTVERRKS
ncbi:type 1 glutamine amidotransferase [Phenylobacterium sp.]|uniref:type 1 glutamine amidotransferase n=1 Tax=Phenylobacterium sp. TaxID=1871053 RepID=UPI002F3EC98A